MGPRPVTPLDEQASVQCGDSRALPNRLSPEIVLIETAHVAAGFFQNQAAGGVIPQFLSAMKIEIETTSGDVTSFKQAGTIIALGRKRPRSANPFSQFAAEAFQIDVGDCAA
jgi:hypothetical protein